MALCAATNDSAAFSNTIIERPHEFFDHTTSRTTQFLDTSGCYYLCKPLQFLDFSGQVQALLDGEVLP